LRCITAEISFFDLRAALDQSAPARHEPTQHARAVIADPHVRDQVGGEQIGKHLRVDLVGLHTRVADRPDLLGVGEHHLADMRLQDPGDRQRVARGLHHDAVVRSEALREQLKLLWRCRDPHGRPRAAAVGDRDLTEVAMHV
jgi:hypothetical protein